MSDDEMMMVDDEDIMPISNKGKGIDMRAKNELTAKGREISASVSRRSGVASRYHLHKCVIWQ
jgi:hypothetical protein